jgi:hypothetical protein
MISLFLPLDSVEPINGQNAGGAQPALRVKEGIGPGGPGRAKPLPFPMALYFRECSLNVPILFQDLQAAV